ncbi:MAG: arsenite efflux transporter metallochaperone ArsD [Thioalkalivibrio sp.]
MKTIQVFDPALCCSTGVCGVDVDQQLVDFSATIRWAQQNGLTIERFNLAQQPMAFAENPVVKEFLEIKGEQGLPLVLVEGEIRLSGRYPERAELEQWSDAPGPESLFTVQVAELVAIGAAIAANCEPCFKYHYGEARKLGVSHEDMRRAVDLAQKVKDTPARAMLDLAGRYLESKQESSGDRSAAGASANPAPASCCGGSSEEPTAPAAKCC